MSLDGLSSALGNVYWAWNFNQGLHSEQLVKARVGWGNEGGHGVIWGSQSVLAMTGANHGRGLHADVVFSHQIIRKMAKVLPESARELNSPRQRRNTMKSLAENISITRPGRVVYGWLNTPVLQLRCCKVDGKIGFLLVLFGPYLNLKTLTKQLKDIVLTKMTLEIIAAGSLEGTKHSIRVGRKFRYLGAAANCDSQAGILNFVTENYLGDVTRHVMPGFTFIWPVTLEEFRIHWFIDSPTSNFLEHTLLPPCHDWILVTIAV